VVIPAAPEKAPTPPSGYERTDGGLSYIPGGPDDPAVIARNAAARKGGEGGKLLREGDAQKLTDDASSVEAIERALNSFQDDFVGLTADVENMAQGVAGIGTPGQRDWWADFRATDNVIRNQLFGASLTAGEKSAYSGTTITPRMSADEVRRNLERRLEIARKAAARRFDRLNAAGYNPDEVAAIVGEVDIKTPVDQRRAQQAEPQQLALTAGENFSTEKDKAIAAAVNQTLAQGGGVEELAAAAQAAGGQISPDDIANFQRAVEARAQGQSVTFNTRRSGTRSPIAQAAGEALMTPAGTAITGAVNAAGLGVLSQFAGDQVQGLESLNPTAGMIGEIGGSMLGTAGLAKGAAMGLGAVAPNIAGRLAGGGLAGAAGRELATEAAYGGIYAGNTGEDIGTGVALGALGSLGGQAIGAGVRRAAPVIGGAVGRAVGRVMGREGAQAIPPNVAPDGGAPSMGGGMGGGEVPPMAAGMDEPFTPTSTTFRGGGAEGTSLEAQRLAQAEGLPVPVELTRGAATRDPEQLAFEKEELYSALGGPLRKRAEENNLQVLENFDRFIDQTGAMATENIADSGNAVIKALSNGYQAAKNKVNVAYRRAETSEGAQEPVEYAKLKAFIDGQDEATKEISPVLKSVAQQLSKNDPNGTGQITVATMENIRKLISKNAQQGTPSSVYGGEMKGIIDSLTEGKGGELYDKARKLRIEQARKFENRAIVARLVSNVKNMDDPKVAADEVFKKSIMNESPEDIKFLRQTLRTLGPEGRQAWNELQGATVRDIAKKATVNSRKTSDNLDVVSASGVDKAIKALDENGRLDAIFNPKMARQLRDLRDVVIYVNTVPPGTSINSSGTARTLAAMMGEMAITGGATSYLTGSTVPVPIVTGLKMMMKASKDNEIKKKIARSLLPKDAQ
jgi:hypothetical protein